jgi:ribosomal protein S12 methylthiotransferase
MFAFSAINLGCSKNLVDLEFAIGEILKYSDQTQIEYHEDPEDKSVEYVIVNTCGFLSSARQESEETLSYYDSLGKKLILMGCYVSVKDDAFLGKLRNLYSIVPFMSYSVIEELLLGKKSKLNLSAIVRAKQAHKESKEKTLSRYLESIEAPGKGEKAFVWKGDEVRAYIHAPFGYEYLKIAEGCDNNCTFCIIPNIRGRQQSRPMEDIVKEVRQMLESGIQEIQIISQDTTRYGTDLYGEPQLMELLEKIDETVEEWILSSLEKGGCSTASLSRGEDSPDSVANQGGFSVEDKGGSDSENSGNQTPHPTGTPLNREVSFRVYYLYPDILTLEHLDRLAKLKHFLPYFDIPFQHISENILKLMGRHYDQQHIFAFLDKIRSTFQNTPLWRGNEGGFDSFIRTSFIIGFPGETEENFQELCDFIEKYEFESVGIFQYHDEPLAASSKLPNKVPEDIAKNRIERLTPILDGIYAKKKEARKWKKQFGYIMDVHEPESRIKNLESRIVTIRPELHAPEVDEYDEIGIENITSGRIEIGSYVGYIL